jgi:hypothetical protein
MEKGTGLYEVRGVISFVRCLLYSDTKACAPQCISVCAGSLGIPTPLLVRRLHPLLSSTCYTVPPRSSGQNPPALHPCQLRPRNVLAASARLQQLKQIGRTRQESDRAPQSFPDQDVPGLAVTAQPGPDPNGYLTLTHPGRTEKIHAGPVLCATHGPNKSPQGMKITCNLQRTVPFNRRPIQSTSWPEQGNSMSAPDRRHV